MALPRWTPALALVVVLDVPGAAGCGPGLRDEVFVDDGVSRDDDGDEDGVDAGADAGADAGDDGVVDAGADDAVDAGDDDAGDAGDDGDDAGPGPPPDPPPEPDFASLPWQTGDDTGFGVARKDSGNPRGDDVFLGYGGFGAALDDSCAWVTALYEATLRDRGVRFVYCIQGPATVGYTGLEIGNSRVARRLVTQVTPRTRFVLVAAHSSGSFVAHELLRQLQDPALAFDPAGVTADRVVYVNLDGGSGGLTANAVQRLRRAWFVAAVDGDTQTASPNLSSMRRSGGAFGDGATFLSLDVAGSGCAAGGVWCVHMTPIITRPHDPQRAAVGLDYTDFAGRPVATAWIDAVEDDLQP
jgi:hypothetical protein